MSKKILLIDNDNFILKLFSYALRQVGFIVSTVTSGESAVIEIKKSMPDLVFSEIIIPSPNGFELLQLYKKLKIIIISSLRQKSDIDKAIALGAKEYIIKEGLPTKTIVATAKKYLQ